MIADAKQQCSVCWDDFKLDEDVRLLKCEHIFHENCIIPWLELHNTCPVCRQEQETNPGQQSAKPESSVAGSSSNHSEASPGVSSGPSLASSLSGASSGSGAGPGGQDQLMEAIGRSLSVFTNSFFG